MDNSSKQILHIRLIPNELFQVYILDIIEGMTNDETTSFVLLHLEENSPFPIDQLYWGYIESEKRVIIYATYQKTLLKAGYESLETDDYVLPCFIGHLGRLFSNSMSITSRESKWNTTLQFAPGEILPEKVTCESITATKHITAEECLELEQVISIDIVDKGSILCSVTKPTDDEQSEEIIFPSILTIKNIWDADIRPENIKKGLQRYKRKEHLLRRATQGIVSGALMCIVASLLLIGAMQLNKSRQHTIEKQKPLVQEIKVDDLLADKLTTFSTKQMRPFSMLHIVNMTRPQETFFKQVSCDSWNQLLLEGTSPNGTQFNQFLRSLNESDYVEKSQVIKQRTTQGQTSFTLDISFKEIPTYEVLDPEVRNIKEEATNEL